MVTVRTTPFFSEYTINMLNEELLEQLPGNKIISTGPSHFAFQFTRAKEQSPLMECIISAVTNHLQTSTV